MKTYRVTTVRWSGGWELHIEGEGVTQVEDLADADAQVRSFLATVHERDFDDAEIEIVLARP